MHRSYGPEWQKALRDALQVAAAVDEGRDVDTQTEQDVRARSAGLLALLPHEGLLGPFGRAVTELEGLDRWGIPRALRVVVAAHSNRGIATQDPGELVMAAIWMALDQRIADMMGLNAVVADACNRLGVCDQVFDGAARYLRQHGVRGFALQTLERRLRFDAEELQGQGWVLRRSRGAVRYVFDPCEALAQEFAQPGSEERGTIAALDVDTWKRRVRHLPNPSGWDERVTRFMATLGQVGRFDEVAREMTPVRVDSAMLFAFRRAELAVRVADASLLGNALISASLATPLPSGPDDGWVAIGAVLRSAEILGLRPGQTVATVRPVLDAARVRRLEDVLNSPAGVLGAAGLEESVGPDGFAYVGVLSLPPL